MTIFDMPNYLWITILGMILLTVFYTLVLNKWFQSAIITFVVLAVLAFFIPNFQNISYQPLLGYAGFLGIMSLIISFLIWYFSRNWRKNRRKIKLEKRFANMMMKSHFVVINNNFSTLLPSYLKQSCFLFLFYLFSY